MYRFTFRTTRFKPIGIGSNQLSFTHSVAQWTKDSALRWKWKQAHDVLFIVKYNSRPPFNVVVCTNKSHFFSAAASLLTVVLVLGAWGSNCVFIMGFTLFLIVGSGLACYRSNRIHRGPHFKLFDNRSDFFSTLKCGGNVLVRICICFGVDFDARDMQK